MNDLAETRERRLSRQGVSRRDVNFCSPHEIVTRACTNAATTIPVNASSFNRGWFVAAPNPTGAVGVKDAIPGITLRNLPGCFAHFGLPLFASSKRIHDNCERRAHFDAGQSVEFRRPRASANARAFDLCKVGWSRWIREVIWRNQT